MAKTFVSDFQGDDAPTLGVNWREYNLGWRRDSGAAVPDGTGYCVAQYATNVDTDNQFSRMQVGSTWGGGRVGPCVFMPTIGGTNVETGPFYMFNLTGAEGKTAVLVRKTANSATFVTLATVTLTRDVRLPGTKIELAGWVDGTVVELRGFINGEQVISTRDSSPGATVNQRRVGMYASGPNATLLRIAAWTGGDRADVIATPPPPVPTGLVANTPQPQMAFVQWNAALGATAYELVYQTGGVPANGSVEADGTVTPSAPLDPTKWQVLTRTTNTNYSHTNLTEDVLYTYAVRSVGPGGVSALSEPVSIIPYFVRGTPWKVWVGGQKVPAFLRGIWLDGKIVPVFRHYVYFRPVPPPVVNPNVAFTVSRVDQTVTVNAAGSAAGSAAIVDHVIDWGDGQTTTIADPTRTASHVYAVPNDTTQPFTITVQARALDGGTDTDVATVSVPGPITQAPTITNPTVGFNLGRIDQTVTVNAAATTAGSSPIARHEITWGDGTALTTITEPTRTADHTYAPPPEGRDYTVTVVAVGTDGGRASLSRQINVPAPTGGGGNPVGSVVRMFAGNLSSSGFTVGATTQGGAQVRLVASTSSTLTSVVRGPAVTPDSAGYVKASISGLQPNTVYYYALELGGGVYTARTHKLKTAPLVGSFKFCFASCAGGQIAADGSHPGMNVAGWTRIKDQAPIAFVHLGDMTYHNNSAASEAAYHTMYNVFQQGTTSGPMLREVPVFYTWSDHCFGPNNSYGGGGAGATVKPYAQSAYRKRFPSPPLPSTTGGIYHTFVIGRVRFIVADQRSYKSHVTTTQTPGKTMLGTEQKAWAKKVITDSPEKYIVWCSDVFFSFANNDDDGWPAFQAERQEMADFFKASGKVVEIISGDQHSIAYDDGTNSLGIVNMHAASINSGSSVKTVPLTFGPSGGSNQFGSIEIQDTGGTTITRIFRAHNSAGTVAYTNTRTITVGAPTVDTTPPSAPTNLAAGTPTATSIPLTWTASTDNVDVTSYTVLNRGAVLQSGLTGTSGTLVGLSASTQYVLTLRAQDAAGNQSPVSNQITVTTAASGGGGGDTSPPTAPSNLAAGTATSSSIPLTWTASTDNVGVVGYHVYNSGNLIRQGVTGTSVTLTGLTASTTYTLTVRAYDAAGNISPVSNGISVTTPAGTVEPPPTGQPFIAYSTDSFFRKKLPAGTPVSTRSAEGVAFVKANDPFPYLKIRGVGANQWGMPYGYATGADPIWKIGTGNVPTQWANQLKTVGFHCPDDTMTKLTGTSDSPFVIIDRGTGITIWGYQAVKGTGRVINVTNSGVFEHNSNGLDRRNPKSNSTKNERSRGVIPDSMMIRVDLLDWAVKNNTSIGHVLECFWVETNTVHGFCHPMVAEEGSKFGWGAEGERFRIKPGINLAARVGSNPTSTQKVGLAIARTLQDYGAYLGDNSGSGSGIKTEQGASYAGLTDNCLQGIMTWDDIEFLPLGWDG